jgi:hypothetical protein
MLNNTSIIIDNVVITKYNGGGIRITPIKLCIKYVNNFNVNNLEKLNFGSVAKDNKIISSLATGKIKYDDLFNYNN